MSPGNPDSARLLPDSRCDQSDTLASGQDELDAFRLLARERRLVEQVGVARDDVQGGLPSGSATISRGYSDAQSLKLTLISCDATAMNSVFCLSARMAASRSAMTRHKVRLV